MAWFPGQEMGDALVDVLFGDVEPQGRLPVTFPRRLEDTPAFEHHPGRNGAAPYLERRLVGYRWYDTVGREPLFPFGHGLGYADVSIASARATDPFTVEAELDECERAATASQWCRCTCTGQLHDGAGDEPAQRLVGFAKVDVPGNGRGDGDRRARPRTYMTWDVDTHAWIDMTGGFELRVGTSSRQIVARLEQQPIAGRIADVRAGVVIAGSAAIVFVPVVVALVALARPTWYPTGDMAQAELHVRGFWSHPPLVGAAGRIQNVDGVQGSHPGRRCGWRCGRSTPRSGRAAWRSWSASRPSISRRSCSRCGSRGGAVAPVFAVVLAACLAFVVRAGGPDVFTEPWNPWMGLLPFLVFVLSLWCLLERDLWAAPLAVVAGSYSIQAHAGYLLVVVGMLVGGDGRGGPGDVARRSAPARGRGPAGRVLAGVVAWLPPLVDQLRRSPGNVSILIDNFRHPDGPYLGLGDVAEIVVVQLNLFGPWVFGPGRDSFGVVAVVGFVGLLVLWGSAVRVARSRRAASELRLHALLGVAWLLAVVSIARIFGPYFEYTVRWLWLLTVLVITASVWTLWRGRGRRRPRRVGSSSPSCRSRSSSRSSPRCSSRPVPNRRAPATAASSAGSCPRSSTTSIVRSATCCDGGIRRCWARPASGRCSSWSGAATPWASTRSSRLPRCRTGCSRRRRASAVLYLVLGEVSIDARPRDAGSRRARRVRAERTPPAGNGPPSSGARSNAS